MKARRHSGGFTLIELMVVVVILALLGVLAVNIYKRYTMKAKASEALTMLAHIKAKQEAYQAEHYRYAHIPTYWPTTVMKDKKVPFAAGLPAEWKQLGVQATMKETYFQYATISDQGNPSVNNPPAGLGLTNGQVWFTATAQGRFDDASSNDTTYEIVSNRDTVWKMDKFGNRGAN